MTIAGNRQFLLPAVSVLFACLPHGGRHHCLSLDLIEHTFAGISDIRVSPYGTSSIEFAPHNKEAPEFYRMWKQFLS